MMFWDSSALAPLILRQPRYGEMAELLRHDDGMVVWWGSLVECSSAVERVYREGKIDAAGRTMARTILERLRAAWHEVGPTEQARRAAIELLARAPLRSQDAQQLAAAVVWCDGRPRRAAFVCLDRRLREAAAAEGFALQPPAL